MKRLFIVLLFLCVAIPANAATCFWVGGTGTWDNATDGAHWANSTGGSASSCAATGGVPKNAGDVAAFDFNSGGGTVTNNVNLNIGAISMGSFGGTLDFATNNKTVTLSSFANSGNAARTLNMGSGTWTITGTSGIIWDQNVVLGLTFNPNTSNLVFSATSASTRTMTPGGGSILYKTVTIAANSAGGIFLFNGSLNTDIWNVVGPEAIQISVAGLNANTLGFTGTSGGNIFLFTSTPGSTGSLAVPSGTQSMAFVGARDIVFGGGATFNLTCSLDLGHNSGATISPITGACGSAGTRNCMLNGWLLWRDMPEHLNDNFPAWLEKTG